MNKDFKYDNEIGIGTSVKWTPTGEKGKIIRFWAEIDRNGDIAIDVLWESGKQGPYYFLKGELELELN